MQLWALQALRRRNKNACRAPEQTLMTPAGYGCQRADAQLSRDQCV